MGTLPATKRARSRRLAAEEAKRNRKLPKLWQNYCAVVAKTPVGVPIGVPPSEAHARFLEVRNAPTGVLQLKTNKGWKPVQRDSAGFYLIGGKLLRIVSG